MKTYSPKSLSISQIQAYATCGKRWQLERALRVPFQRSIQMIFGTALHAGLETFAHELYPGSKRRSVTEVDMEHVRRMFFDSMDEQLRAEPDAIKLELQKLKQRKNASKKIRAITLEEFTPQLVQEWKQTGSVLLDQYAARSDHGDFVMMIEEKDDVDINGLQFKFVADLVDIFQGKVRLTDYKAKQKSDALLARLQLAAYAWVLEIKYKVRVEIIRQLNFVRVESDPRIEEIPYPMESHEFNVEVLKQEIDMFLLGVRSSVFPRNIGPFCAACGVKEVCYNPRLEMKHLVEQEKSDLGLLKV